MPLVYRFTRGLVQLFRCAHRPDFESGGEIVCMPFNTLELTSKIVPDPWWDADRLRTGTLWDDPTVCKQLLSSKQSAQKTLINAIKELHQKLNDEGITIVMVTHELDIASYTKRNVIMRDGVVVNDTLVERRAVAEVELRKLQQAQQAVKLST